MCRDMFVYKIPVDLSSAFVFCWSKLRVSTNSRPQRRPQYTMILVTRAPKRCVKTPISLVEQQWGGS